MNLLKRHLSVANVISCMALFVALSGAAYAATTIGKKSVKAQHLGNGSVTAQKIRKGAVTTPKLRNGAVISTKIATGAVGTTQIADGSVRSSKLGGGVVTEAKLKDRAVGGNKIARGAITDFQLAPDAVGQGKILDGSIAPAELRPAFLAQLVKNVSYATKASESNTTTPKSVFVECPFGKQVVGGGARIVGSTTTVAITESFPTNSGEKRTSWSAAAQAIAAEANPWAVETYAICAEF